MKKLLLVPTLMLAFFFSTMSSVSAADVWVDRWDSENTDIYVVDETISGNSHDFSAVVKEVRNGQLLSQQVWHYNKYKDDFWRYQTDKMRTRQRMAPVSAYSRNSLFEYCADKLGIYYSIYNNYYY